MMEWGTLSDTSAPFASTQNEVRTEVLTRPLPSPDLETWRYSPVADLVVSDFSPASRPDSAVLDSASSDPTAHASALDNELIKATLEALPKRAGLVITGNGAVASIGDVGAGVDVTTDRLDDYPLPDANYFELLNFGYVIDPITISVGAHIELDAPIVIIHYVDADAVAVPTRVVVDVAENASARILEIVVTKNSGASLVVPHTKLVVAAAARVGYQFLSDCGPDTWLIGSHDAEVHGQSTYDGHFAAFGGRYSRQAISCDLIGRGATGNLAAVSFGESAEVVDYRTFQHHVAPDATSNLLFKGVVDDKARSIYTGMIRVGPEASGTNAFQTNRNIKLSDDAWAESVPNLEIETNDVRCSHASTVGPIDEGQRFYLESHGVPTAEAERLIVAGFFAEVIDSGPVPQVGDLIADRVAERLKEM